jgi:hypothetical protein
MGIVRIPLDYYRILGLPIQATAEQLQQAHRDRILQLPRREFSEAAIEARKQLIDEAYTVLSDSTQRQDYDAGFLAKSYELLEGGRPPENEEPKDTLSSPVSDSELGVDSYTPSIDVEESRFIGALLILQELGEYELVLRLGRPFLSGGTLSLRDGRFGDPEIVAADIVLTVALACLELGREQWQQGQYENAAESLETGQELLLREGLFPNIRGEMQSDLFKLRPYRILELVSLPEDQVAARRQGITLLEDMLHDRGGIDGSGDDLSGLGVEDFLRFIQQLRSHLTAAEQQTLFQAEARRPSAVATYLAVYALLARGFATRQPALIRQAKLMLMRLGSRQDVHLEQAVCALLLGQTEEASRALELSQEFESLAFIRDNSQGAPDLLPGLCLYSERWLQSEVFPHFRDLAKRQASLKEYFADEDVQVYLEELPAEAEPAEWSAPSSVPSPSWREEKRPAEPHMFNAPAAGYAAARATATIEAPAMADASMPAAERVTQSPETSDNGAHAQGSRGGKGKRPASPSENRPAAQNGARTAPQGNPSRRSGAARSTLRFDRILLLAAAGLLSIMLLGFLFSRLLNRSQLRTASAPANSRVANSAAQTGFSQFVADQKPIITANAPLTEENAPEIIETWLSAKAAAMGEEHNTQPLEEILVDPALSQQRARSEQMRAANSYGKYEHGTIEIVSVETSGTPEADSTGDPDAEATANAAQTAQIEAIVAEKADFYVNGQLDASSSYDSTVRVRYDLVRENGQWRIRDMTVLE